MTFARLAALMGIALLVLIVNIGITVLYMVLYGHVIDPGHENKYYQEHVKLAAPYCSILAGFPLMLLAGWWVAGLWDGVLRTIAGLIVWVSYAVIDVALLVASGLTTRIAVLMTISLLTKLAGALLGALIANRATQS